MPNGIAVTASKVAVSKSAPGGNRPSCGRHFRSWVPPAEADEPLFVTASGHREAYVAVARNGSVVITWEQASRLHPVVDDGWQLPARGG
jgi:hypothetical protein